MRALYPIIAVAVTAVLGSCVSGSRTTNGTPEKAVVNTGYAEQDARNFVGSASNQVDPNATLDLTDNLRRMAGVYVTGEGGEARVKVQSGANSITAGTEPLFIVNGSQVNSYREAYELVSFSKVAITVLKDPSSTSMYGTRGGNGVILINVE